MHTPISVSQITTRLAVTHKHTQGVLSLMAEGVSQKS